jgi:hemerythrin
MLIFDSSLKTGNTTIDAQHSHLIDLFNKVKFKIDNSENSIGLILEELMDYADYHFKTEEELFTKYNYPKTDEHVIEHKEYIIRVQEFIKLYMKNNIKKDAIDNFLIEWIIFHIKNSDQEYAKYFKEKGIF